MITPSITPNGHTLAPLHVRSSTRILVVGDDHATGALLAESFDAPAFQVEMAGDGTEALNTIRRFPPDVIVVDATLPGLDHWGPFAYREYGVGTLGA